MERVVDSAPSSFDVVAPPADVPAPSVDAPLSSQAAAPESVGEALASDDVAGQALHGPELAATTGPAVPTETLVGQILSAQPTDAPFVGSVVDPVSDISEEESESEDEFIPRGKGNNPSSQAKKSDCHIPTKVINKPPVQACGAPAGPANAAPQPQQPTAQANDPSTATDGDGTEAAR